MSVDGFFQFARERYRIFLKRRQREAPPWTDDPVLRRWFFCNIFREDDRTTVWFRRNVRDFLRRRPEVLLATIVFRWFNRIETCEKILDLFVDWDTEEARRRLTGTKPLVTGAYIIKTPDGMDKLTGILSCIDNVVADDSLENEICGATLEDAHATFTQFPYLGNFMAYEIVTDLRYTYLLENAPDIGTWACPGPGCARGLGWVTEGDPATFSYASKGDQERMIELMGELLLCSTFEFNWPRDWPSWEMREVEHTLCEYDKYRRGQAGQQLKRKYHASDQCSQRTPGSP